MRNRRDAKLNFKIINYESIKSVLEKLRHEPYKNITLKNRKTVIVMIYFK